MKNRIRITLMSTLCFILILAGCSASGSSNDSESVYDLNQKGIDQMDEEDYQGAYETFTHALEIVDKDNGELVNKLYNNLSWSSYSAGDYDAALKYGELSVSGEFTNDNNYVNYGNALMEFERESDALTAYRKALDYNDSQEFALYGVGKAYYLLGNYEEAVDAFDVYINTCPDDVDGYFYRALSNEAIEDKDAYNKDLKYLLNFFPDEPKTMYLDLDSIYSEGTEAELASALKAYSENWGEEENARYFAIWIDDNTCYEELLNLVSDMDVQTLPLPIKQMMVSAYYRNYQYEACLELGNQLIESGDSNYNATLMVAFAYSDKGNYEKSIMTYGKLYEEEDDFLSYYIALDYYKLGNYDMAEQYLSNIEHPDDSDAALSSLINEKELPIGVQIAHFVEKKYLYDYDQKALDQLLSDDGSMTGEELTEAFYNCIDGDDNFSFIIGGNYYELYKAENEMASVTSDINEYGDAVVTINTFTDTTGIEFREAMRELGEFSEHNMILDLTGNGGGDTYSGYEVLDELLPYCVTFSEIYKDGTSEPFYSDEYAKPFKKIYVLVDGETASCSEIVALGLKTYLDGVVLIGEKTFGKGVGQSVYSNEKDDFALFVVNHYINIRQNNIHNKGIDPDIQLSAPSYEKAKALIYQ